MKMRFGKNTWLIIIVSLTCAGLKAQDHLSGLPYNPVLKQHAEKPGLKSFKATTDTLELPFIDDFSSTTLNPDENKWLNNYVYINNEFAANPMSVGVATFDAYNPNGKLYTKTNLNGIIPADTLTSAPIFLDVTPETGNSIYMTFYYQIGGLAPSVRANNGDQPDSLIFELYRPSTNKWYKAWGIIPDTITTEFERVDIQIADSLYENGFQFRFRNKVKKYDNHPDGFYAYAPWHIDYVILEEGLENDPRPTQDVAFTGRGDFIFQNGYKSIPWSHYATAQSNILNTSITVHLSNFSEPNGLANSLSYTVRDEISGFEEIGDKLDTTLTMTTDKDSLNFDREYILSPNNNDSAMLSIHYQMDVPLSEDIESNNEFVIQYLSSNYYAYDDGSAEAVLQIPHNDIWASRFESFEPDTLRAVDIYFLPSYGSKDITRYFNIYVWDEGEDGPGELLLQKEGNVVDFEDNRNGFVRYYLEPLDTLLTGEVFYIGIQNKTFQGNTIGLGVDANSQIKNTYELNDNSQWIHKKENVPYALMIRPVMGKKVEIPVSVPNVPHHKPSITIYPNPASDRVHIRGLDDLNETYQVSIYNTVGQQVDQFINQQSFNVSHLSEGIYIMVIRVSGQTTTQKLIISR